MTQQANNDQIGESAQQRSRGPGKPFPPITFEDAVFLPKSILEHGFDGNIQRLTLLNQIHASPSSVKTRNLISGSYRYGLTEGSYNAPSLSVTDAGRAISDSALSSREAKEKRFDLAINQFEPFKNLYEKLKDKRLRDGRVLHDEMCRLGISDGDCQQAAEMFTANLRFLDLVHDMSGSEYVKSIEQAFQESPETTGSSQPESQRPAPVATDDAVAEGNSKGTLATNRPTLHIDIQVHIDPTSSPEQIDHIFASMAKHLYGSES